MQFVIDGEMDILDTASQEEYSAMQAQYMRAGEGFLLHLCHWQHEIIPRCRVVQKLIQRVQDCDDIP